MRRMHDAATRNSHRLINHELSAYFSRAAADTEAGGEEGGDDSDDEEDPRIVSLDEDLVFQEKEYFADLHSALHGKFGEFCADWGAFCDAWAILELPSSAVIQRIGDVVRHVYIIISRGPAVLDEETGEWMSKGAVINLECAIFNERYSKQSLVSGAGSIIVGRLEADRFPPGLRTSLIKHRFSVFSHLTDECLRSLEFRHKWIQPGAMEVVSCPVLVTSGLLAYDSIMVIPGYIAGIDDLSGVEHIARAVNRVGCAFISSLTPRFMRANMQFTVAVSDMYYQLCVVNDEMKAAREAEGGGDDESPLPPPDPSSPPSAPPRVPRVRRVAFDTRGEAPRINQYRIVGKAGSGATAKVFEAVSASTGARVALKIMNKQVSKNSLEREVTALQALRHDRIINAIEIIDGKSTTVLVLEYAMFGSLINTVFGYHSLAKCLYDITGALMHMHGMGFVHGDVKPANILRCGRDLYKLSDFGCCFKFMQSTNKGPRGTHFFMSPESFQGAMTPVSDAWSLCVTSYMLVYGSAPFKATCDEELSLMVRYNEPSFRKVGSDTDYANFVDLIKNGLRKNPALRLTAQQIRAHIFTKTQLFQGRGP